MEDSGDCSTLRGRTFWRAKTTKLIAMAVLVFAILGCCFFPATTEAKKSKAPNKLYELYPYYWKSKIRYPYYDKFGRGKLLYGYGGKDLYEYTAFKPIDGYYRRK